MKSVFIPFYTLHFILYFTSCAPVRKAFIRYNNDYIIGSKEYTCGNIVISDANLTVYDGRITESVNGEIKTPGFQNSDKLKEVRAEEEVSRKNMQSKKKQSEGTIQSHYDAYPGPISSKEVIQTSETGETDYSELSILSFFSAFFALTSFVAGLIIKVFLSVNTSIYLFMGIGLVFTITAIVTGLIANRKDKKWTKFLARIGLISGWISLGIATLMGLGIYGGDL